MHLLVTLKPTCRWIPVLACSFHLDHFPFPSNRISPTKLLCSTNGSIKERKGKRWKGRRKDESLLPLHFKSGVIELYVGPTSSPLLSPTFSFEISGSGASNWGAVKSGHVFAHLCSLPFLERALTENLENYPLRTSA